MNFVLMGHHRSSSSYILDVMRHNKNVETINEPFSMHLDFFRNDETFWPDKSYYSNKLPYSTCTEKYIQELKVWLNDNNYDVVRGFKETALFEKYDWLVNKLNIDKTVILIRDFRAIINSIIKRSLQDSWWNYRERLKKYYGYKIDKLSDVEVCAYILKERMLYIKNIILNNDVFLLKLEDFIDNRFIATEQLMNYIGLNLSEEQKLFIETTSIDTRDSPYSNYRKKDDVVIQWKDGLSKEDVKIINGILKEEMEYFGYSE